VEFLQIEAPGEERCHLIERAHCRYAFQDESGSVMSAVLKVADVLRLIRLKRVRPARAQAQNRATLTLVARRSSCARVVGLSRRRGSRRATRSSAARARVFRRRDRGGTLFRGAGTIRAAFARRAARTPRHVGGVFAAQGCRRSSSLR